MSAKRGFTLIELLIVLMVIGVASSLVGPATLRQFEKVKIIEERENLSRILESVSFDSFTHRRKAEVELRGRIVHLRFDNRNVQEWQFTYLSFPHQYVTANRHGFWQQDKINWIEDEATKTLQLRSVVNRSEPLSE